MFLESINLAQSSPSNPAGTTSATAVMMGLGAAITPFSTGRVLLLISGSIFNLGIGQGAKAQLSYGTGAAPTNGAALTGTQVGGAPPFVSGTVADKVPFMLNAVVSGLTKKTPIWVDLAVSAQTAGTATVSDLSVTLVEL